MSLLLDALKKTGSAESVHGSPAKRGTPELTLETLPQMPQEKVETEAEDSLARMSAQQLFAAKPVRAGTRLGIVPLALFAALLLAAGGGYYVWREISPAPMAMLQKPAPSTLVNATPTAIMPPAPMLAPAELPVAAEIAPNGHAATKTKRHTVNRAPAPASSALATSAAAPAASAPQAIAADAAQPIRIEHGKESTAIDPALIAAYQAYLNGDFVTARKYYGDALHKDPKSRDALLGLAAIALQQSQDDIAAHHYRQVLALDPRDPVAQAGMATLFGTADMAGTESRLKRLLIQSPQSATLNFALGNHYADQSRWSEAQHAYFNAVSLDQADGRFAFNLAVSLDHLGQRKLAAQYYRSALQLSPSGNTGFDRAQAQQRANDLAAP